ncbi:MAG: hypothetical protein ACOCQ0_03525 [Desulfosalsimonas sp.]
MVTGGIELWEQASEAENFALPERIARLKKQGVDVQAAALNEALKAIGQTIR